MARVFYQEVKEGRAFFLDCAQLQSQKDCSSSAYVDPAGVHHFQRGQHYHLVLEELEDDLWLTAPLSSQLRTYRHPLTLGLKGGWQDQWAVTQDYYIEREFWKIPATAICRASHLETSPAFNRRIYGYGLRQHLLPMINWSAINPHPFITVI